MQRGGCVYILTNYKRTTFYTGVTADLLSRLLDHKQKKYPNSFTARYNLAILIYYEVYSNIEEAIDREKYIKGKSRKWKEELMKKNNPDLDDLWEDVKDW